MKIINKHFLGINNPLFVHSSKQPLLKKKKKKKKEKTFYKTHISHYIFNDRIGVLAVECLGRKSLANLTSTNSLKIKRTLTAQFTIRELKTCHFLMYF